MKSLKEIKDKILELIDPWDDPEIEVSTEGENYRIRLWCMYDPPRFKKPESFLTGMMRIAEICGKTELTLDDEISCGGCETCDFGSAYGYEFVAWNKKEDVQDK